MNLGSKLRDMTSASPWMLGDWLAYGFANYQKTQWGNRVPDGLYEQLAKQLGMSESTLANTKCVCSAIPPSRRREGLTVAHAAEIIGRVKDVDGQDFWIAEVVEKGLSVKALRERIRGALADSRAELGDRGTKSALETARQFVRDFLPLEERLPEAGAKEVLRILEPVLRRLTKR